MTELRSRYDAAITADRNGGHLSCHVSSPWQGLPEAAYSCGWLTRSEPREAWLHCRRLRSRGGCQIWNVGGSPETFNQNSAERAGRRDAAPLAGRCRRWPPSRRCRAGRRPAQGPAREQRGLQQPATSTRCPRAGSPRAAPATPAPRRWRRPRSARWPWPDPTALEDGSGPGRCTETEGW
jgi:hypothetical protein